ncbi:MAG TPA: SAM-dependent methyltransferase [Micromonospora sp.]
MTTPDATADRPTAFDPEVANVARMYDYYLGGTYNLPADRARAARIQTVLPAMEILARLNRGFLRRAVRFMLGEGIDQFLDLGSGLPTAGNVHEVAQAVRPDAKVVYVDYEPVAVAHGEQILANTPNVAIVNADARKVDEVLNHPRVRELLDLDRPLGVIMAGVMVFVGDHDDPAGMVRAYRNAVAPGSFIAISHLTAEQADPETKGKVHAMVAAYQGVTEQLYVRDRAPIAAWFDGMTLLDPGVTLMPEWRPYADREIHTGSPAHQLGYGGVGRVD